VTRCLFMLFFFPVGISAQYVELFLSAFFVEN
jgi:hypothetical protein